MCEVAGECVLRCFTVSDCSDPEKLWPVVSDDVLFRTAEPSTVSLCVFYPLSLCPRVSDELVLNELQMQSLPWTLSIYLSVSLCVAA